LKNHDIAIFSPIVKCYLVNTRAPLMKIDI